MDKKADYKIFGKKVFFLYPSFTFQSEVIDRLRTLEYEVYILNDYKIVKNILLKNPDSLLYINIDNNFNANTWINFIQSIEDSSERYGNCKIGIFAEKTPTDTVKRFDREILHEAENISLTGDWDENFRAVVKLLDMHEAKGMRQYVRTTCKNDSTAEVFWLEKNKMFKFKLIDISSTGLAVKIPEKMADQLHPGQLLKNISVMLRGNALKINASIFAIKPGRPFCTGVFMIQNDTDKKAIETIRIYISENLYRLVEDSIFGMQIDRTDYSLDKPVTK